MIRERILAIDVVAAAQQRIVNIFANGLPIWLSFSGGKDSLVLAHLTLDLIRRGRIDKRLLKLEFIDEEAIFPCVERICMETRDTFAALGVGFDWYCLEVKHYSCLSQLENDESFICWDRTKKAVWIRTPPPFAICRHQKLKPREDTYQQFLSRVSGGLHMTGVRASESIQRRSFLATMAASGIPSAGNAIHPIYDWHDSDVWQYLSQNRIDVPEAYLHLYQIGVGRKALRISQFFSIDTVATLSRISQFYPGLMERILLREPSAYLVSLYWNSEMFRRRSPTRQKLDELQTETVDQRQRLLDLLANPPEQVLRSPAALSVLAAYRTMLLKLGSMMTQEHFRTACEALITGDPKQRVKRALITSILSHETNAPGRRAAVKRAAGPAVANRHAL